MLYLEDFLELIEQLPGELRDRFTEMRELDLQVQNGMDRNEDRIRSFFRRASTLATSDRKKCYDLIKEEYKKILEDAEEKVNLANTMYDLVERYQRKLEQEVTKFQIELEADNPGITDVLEQKVRQSEAAGRAYKRQERKRKRLLEALQEQRRVSSNDDASPSALASQGGEPSLPRGSTLAAVLGLHPLQQRRSQSYPSRLSDIRALNANSSNQRDRDATVAAALAARAAAAAAATEHQRGASGGQPGTSQQHGILPTFRERESRHGRPRKLTSRVQEMLKETMQKQEQQRGRLLASISSPGGADTDDDQEDAGNEEDEEEEETHDYDQADQRRWCICNQQSYGEMVACDSPECPFEWFHYDCVNITQPPKGKWFCPHCTDAMKRRKTTQ